MSDFDREAERERLREKYERDQQKREQTERMSELLLKGATMTNAHCENCGDPIFRYEGDEFCPTCQQLVESDAEADGTDDAGTSDGDAADTGTADTSTETTSADAPDQESDAGTPDSIEMKQPTGPTADAGANGEGATAGSDAEQAPSDRTPDRETREQSRPERRTREQTTPQRQDGARRRQSRSSQPSASTSARAESSGTAASQPATGGSGDLADARASLTRALGFHAEQAAETADPRRAKDHLAAAREAAEALSALY